MTIVELKQERAWKRKSVEWLQRLHVDFRGASSEDGHIGSDKPPFVVEAAYVLDAVAIVIDANEAREDVMHVDGGVPFAKYKRARRELAFSHVLPKEAPLIVGYRRELAEDSAETEFQRGAVSAILRYLHRRVDSWEVYKDCAAVPLGAAFSSCGAPAEARHRNAKRGVDRHAFTFETKTLFDSGNTSSVGEAQVAARVDDAVPWDIRAVGEAMQCIANEPGVARHPG